MERVRGKEERIGSVRRGRDERIGRVVGLERTPDGLLLRLRTRRGDIVEVTEEALCPCLEAFLELVGERIHAAPLEALQLYPSCLNGQFVDCDLFADDCDREEYLLSISRALLRKPHLARYLIDIDGGPSAMRPGVERSDDPTPPPPSAAPPRPRRGA